MKKSILGLVSIALLGSFIGSGLRYLFNVVIARGLGEEALGIFAFGMVVMKALSVVARFGLDTATQKYIPIYGTNDDYAKVCGVTIFALLFSFIFGLLISIFIFVIVDIGGYWIEFRSEISLFLIGLPFFASMMIGRTATTGFKETQYAVYIRDIIQPVTGILFISMGVYYFRNIELAIAGYVTSLVVGALFGVYFLHRLGAFQAFPDFEIRKTLIFAGPAVIVAAAQYIVSWTDIIMLGYFVPTDSIGRYQAAYQTSLLLIVILGAVNSIFPTVASDLYSEGMMDELEQMYSTVTKWVTNFSIFGLIFITIYSSEILLLFNIADQRAQVSLIILIFGQAVSASTGPVGFLLTMSGHERLESSNTIVIALLNIFLNYYLIQIYGIIGAALATGLSLILLNIIRLGEIAWIHNIQPYNLEYWKGGFSIIVSTVFLIIMSPFANDDLIITILVGSIALILFLIIIFMLGFSEQDRKLIKEIQ